jgi:hypothetical protein
MPKRRRCQKLLRLLSILTQSSLNWNQFIPKRSSTGARRRRKPPNKRQQSLSRRSMIILGAYNLVSSPQPAPPVALTTLPHSRHVRPCT